MGMSTKTVLWFCSGICVGIVIGIMFLSVSYKEHATIRITEPIRKAEEGVNKESIEENLVRNSQSLERKLSNIDTKLDSIFKSVNVTKKQEHRHVEVSQTRLLDDSKFHKDDHTIADDLYRKVRVLCWVMTQPANLETRAQHLRNTWGKRCNKLLFFSSVENKTFPTIGVGTTEGRDQLTPKTYRAFRHVYENYFHDYDWFMRTDDDGYVIMENLRYFLSGQDPNGTVYFGHHFKTIVPGGYYSGGPGIVMGKEALRRFGEKGKDPSICKQTAGGADDVEIGVCMKNLGISTGNSTDVLGRSRFHCFDPPTHVMGYYPDWYYAYDANGATYGINSMSDYPIGFHYVNKETMYTMEYFLYHARPYGILFGNQDLNRPLKKETVTVNQ